MRLFFQIGLPAPARADVDAALAGLRGAQGLSLARAEQLHFTVVFLGELPEASLAGLGEAGGEVQSTLGFELEVAGAGAFPSAQRPRALWLGVGEGRSALCALTEELSAALRRRGFPLESRPPSPHLTVARVRRGREVAARAALSALPSGTVTRFRVGSLALMQSVLGPGGARHTALRTFPLAPPRGALP